MSMAQKLVEDLKVQDAFVIPVFGGIHIAESVVVSWVVMGILVALALWLTHGMKVRNPGKKQVAVEAFLTWLEKTIKGMLGPDAGEYAEYLMTVIMFIGLSNIIGLLGMKPPTKDLDVTAALAIMSIVLIEAAGIKRKGVLGWLKSFAQPVGIVTPINILEVFIRPLSLCMRLFGNVLGSYVIMTLIENLIPVGVPLIFSFYFDIFDGMIQAYVFVFLTSLFIAEAAEITPEEPKKKKTRKNKKKAVAVAA